jgi:hypothetical protein
LRALRNVQIRESYDRIPLALQPLRARTISFLAFQMRGSVDFDDELLFKAAEVDDVLSDGYLPPEFQSGQTATPEMTPERLFGGGLGVAQLAGAGSCGG